MVHYLRWMVFLSVPKSLLAILPGRSSRKRKRGVMVWVDEPGGYSADTQTGTPPCRISDKPEAINYACMGLTLPGEKMNL